jgi:hypothetical protein
MSMGTQRNAGEITLRDLLAWEPRLRAAAGQVAAALDRDVDWVITARASDPPLPTLRGGELILLPRRVYAAIGRPLPLLLNELAGQPVAGVVVDVDPPGATTLPVLAVETITPELESELNRLLTTRRGDLLRASAELERVIAEVSARETPLAELVPLLARRLGVPLAIVTSAGATLVAGADDAPEAGPADANGVGAVADEAAAVERLTLGGGRTLRLGPFSPAQRAFGRQVGPRVREVLSGAVARSVANRPVGSARAAILNQLLLAASDADRERIAADAVRVGLPAVGRCRVALAPATLPEATVSRVLGRTGEALEAGSIDGHAAFVVVEPVGGPSGASGSEPRLHDPVPDGWLALSAPVTTPVALPSATRQARYIAALLTSGELQPPKQTTQSSVVGLSSWPQSFVVRFEDDVRLGAFRLLYPLWGSPELAAYVDRQLGSLLAEDRRGLLQQTLRSYLETGGSPGATAERLGIHRNTLAYRLRQLRRLPTANADDPTTRLGLHLALLAAALPAPPVEG